MVMKAVTFVFVGLLVASAAAPSFARTREQAVQECSAAAGKYINHVWGNAEGATYRSCMAQRGYEE
jgi:hypothetical protein